MRTGGGIYRQPGGLIVLLAFLLSLLPVASQAAAADPNQRPIADYATDLSLGLAAKALVPQAVEALEPDPDEQRGKGGGAVLPSLPLAVQALDLVGANSLPPAQAPPASSAADTYQARAPPLR